MWRLKRRDCKKRDLFPRHHMFAFKASNSSFHIKMAHILWLTPGITSKWDNQCLTCSHLKGLYVTYVGGICWYTICKFNTTEYFLGDIMPGIITASGEHLGVILTSPKSDDSTQNVDLPNLCLCAPPTSWAEGWTEGILFTSFVACRTVGRMAGCENPINCLLVAHV